LGFSVRPERRSADLAESENLVYIGQKRLENGKAAQAMGQKSRKPE